MQYYLTTFWALFIAQAHAGTLTLETDMAVEVKYGETTIARAPEAGSLNIGELPEGPVTLSLIRAGKAPMIANIQVHKTETTTLSLSGDTLTIEGTPVTVQQPDKPIVLIKPAKDQRFTMIINGQDRRVIERDTLLEDIGPGTHQIEVRSENQLIVWARGTLELLPGSTVSLFVEEGRMVNPDGTANAWMPTDGY